ncbi:MAG: hypothetical protein FWG26_04230 [Betaproteobacteria bacterium]|nr:hypothetical protein [Betaproteobacteria bacterium]
MAIAPSNRWRIADIYDGGRIAIRPYNTMKFKLRHYLTLADESRFDNSLALVDNPSRRARHHRVAEGLPWREESPFP